MIVSSTREIGCIICIAHELCYFTYVPCKIDIFMYVYLFVCIMNFCTYTCVYVCYVLYACIYVCTYYYYLRILQSAVHGGLVVYPTRTEIWFQDFCYTCAP